MTLTQLLNQINSATDIQTFAKDNLLKIAESGDGRFILNYDEQQLNTPKTWISHYCRGLTLAGEPGNYQVIAKSFDRFYNIGEFPEYLNGQDEINWDKPFEVQFKYDGSLILLYYWNGQWRVNTRGSFAQSSVSSLCSDSWEKLFWKAMNSVCDNKLKDGDIPGGLNPNYTYIFELCSPYNQVVEYYPETKVVLLGSVNITALEKYTETWKNDVWLRWRWFHEELGSIISQKPIEKPKLYNCKTKEDVFNLLDTLKPTQEGFVIAQWNETNSKYIRRKCKTKTWAALSHMRDGINSQLSLWKIVFRGDMEEVYSIFPHLKEELEKKDKQYQELINSVDKTYKSVQDIKEQKEFAMAIKDIKFKHSLFSLRANQCTLVESAQNFILSNINQYV